MAEQQDQQQQRRLPAIYTLKQIEDAVASDGFTEELIERLQKGFVALENGNFYAAPIQTLGLPPFQFVEKVEGYAAQACIKTGYFKGQDHYVVKVASGGYPLPNSGLMQVFSQKTGRLEALLLDEGLLTEIRTAAIGAMAAKLMGPKNVQMIGVVGTSGQARYQLSMLQHVTNCRSVLVWGRNRSKADILCNDLKFQGWDATPVDDADKLLTDCDIIITTTCSREPLLGKHKLETRKTGQLITAIGADAPNKIELSPKLVAKADLLVADTRQQSIERGEFQEVVRSGMVKANSIIPLGEFLQQETLHRASDDDKRLIIFDSSGVAVQDCIISSLVTSKIN